MKTDSLIPFGPYQWRVLAVQADRALLITEEIIELRWYHSDFVEITWADCALRQYLNDVIYPRLSQSEQAQVLTVTNRNSDNPWFRTNAGPESADKLFLLSLEEVCEYFGNSSAQLQTKGDQTWFIADSHNSNRMARYENDFHWWRLRSPGYYGRTAASVSRDGNVYVRGNGVYGRPKDGGGLRPALWLKLEA